MKLLTLLFSCAVILAGCAAEPRTASGRQLKLERIDHGIRRTPTYAYRPVDR